MSARGIQLDPEIEALLREHAARPGASFFRRERPDVIERLEDREARLTGREPTLSRLQRHLVATYREELARLLLEASLVVYRRDPANACATSTRVSADREVRVATEPELRERTETVSRHDIQPSEPLLLVRTFLRGSDFATVSAVELASASVQLVASDRARIHLAQCLARTGQSRSAASLLRATIAGGAKPIHVSIAWEALGRIELEQGTRAAALAAYRRACDVVEGRSVAGAAWLAIASAVGDADEASSALDYASDALNADAGFVDWFVALVERLRDSGVLEPTSDGARLARELVEGENGLSVRIIHALL